MTRQLHRASLDLVQKRGFSMGFVVMFVVAVGVIIAIAVAFNKVQAEQATATNTNALSTIENFNPAVSFVGGGKGLSGLALDPAAKKFAINDPKTGLHVFGFDQLVAVEVVRNGAYVTATNRGGQIGGAALGAALLGPAGLLIGGLSGSSRTVEKARKLSLKIYVNDLICPVREVVFLVLNVDIPVNSIGFQKAAQPLDEWYGRFQTILQMNARK